MIDNRFERVRFCYILHRVGFKVICGKLETKVYPISINILFFLIHDHIGLFF